MTEFTNLLEFIFRNTADLGICFEIFYFARLTTEISCLGRENRPPEKTAPRNQKSDSIGNLTVNFYKMDVHRPIYDRFPVLKCKVNTFQTHSKWSVDKSSRMRKFIVKTEIELMTTRILQFAPNFGFEALRYIIFTYIKSLVGFSSERFRMSRPIWRNFAWSSAKWPRIDLSVCLH